MMKIYRILDEDNQLFRIVKCEYERDKLLSLDSRFRCDTIVMHKVFNKKDDAYTWAYNKVGECLI
jgi:hypothetical protein